MSELVSEGMSKWMNRYHEYVIYKYKSSQKY